MNKENYLKIEHVSKTYFGSPISLDNANFCMSKNEKICVLGEEKAGKTTLLRVLAGLESFEGNIFLEGEDINNIALKDRNFVINVDNGFFKFKNIKNNLIYPLKLRKCSDEYILKRLNYVCDVFDIGGVLEKKYKKLSILEKAKVELAKIFIRESDLYLIDNPLLKLNEEDRKTLFEILKGEILNVKGAVIYATNLLGECFASNVGVMHFSQFLQFGTQSEITQNPKCVMALKLLNPNFLFYEGVLIKRQQAYYILYDQRELQINCKILSDNFVDEKIVFSFGENSDIINGINISAKCYVFDFYTEKSIVR
ncbi:MAG: ATP-binding cassette domain-containing protein [Clostridia bacterium]